MATEDYKGQFKTLSKRLGKTIKQLKAMPDEELENLIEFENFMDEEKAIRRKSGGFNKGGVAKKAIGASDFRKGGMVLSTVDNRKKK